MLDASTAREVLEQSESRFAQSKEIDVDLGGVGESDSAGLALLIEWLRIARQGGQSIRFANVPAQIEALARISEVEDLIGGEKGRGREESRADEEVGLEARPAAWAHCAGFSSSGGGGSSSNSSRSSSVSGGGLPSKISNSRCCTHASRMNAYGS